MMTETSSWACHLCRCPEKIILADLIGKDGKPYQAVRCMQCGLVAAHPIPEMNTKTLQSLYSKTYYDTGWCDGGEGYNDPAKVVFMEREARSQRLDILHRTSLTQGKILDIGCGNGIYLKEFQSAGWEVEGIEVSKYVAKLAEERLGITIHTQPLEQLALAVEHYDLIRLKHCIEHLPQPLATLQKVAEILKPGGFVVIDTDNVQGLRSRTENTLQRLFGRDLTRKVVKQLTNKDLDSRYGRLTPPIHLYTFSRSTLGRLLNQVELTVTYSLQPAQGHFVWFPQLHRYRCHWLEACFRLIDDLGGKFNRGEVLVVFAKKKTRIGSWSH